MKGSGARGPAELADGVEQHHAVRLQQLAALGEELVIMRGADMLEHADRDDPVELAFDLAIIDQLEPHLVGDAGLLGAPPRDLQLLFGQGHAGHVDARDPVQIERHPAPAAADVEHVLAGLEMRAWRRYAPSCRTAPARGCCPGR